MVGHSAIAVRDAPTARPRRVARDNNDNIALARIPPVAQGAAQTAKAHSTVGSGADKMGGLALPDVVRELLKEKNVLRWDPKEEVYEVLHGDNFEKRFNDLRKVRSKVKAAGTERPFSRMYNFYILEHGDKWARTGTKFRPRCEAAHPSLEILAQVKALENKRATEKGSPTSPRAVKALTPPSPMAAPSNLAPPKVTLAPASHASMSNHMDVDLSRRTYRLNALDEEVPAARHQLSFSVLESKFTGKRPHSFLEDDSMSSTRPFTAAKSSDSLSEQIARAFRTAGISGSRPDVHTFSTINSSTPSSQDFSLSSQPFSSSFIVGARSTKLSPQSVAGKHWLLHDDINDEFHKALEHHHHETEAANAHGGELSDYMHVRGLSPILVSEGEDGSSGFPSPESLLGIGGEFSGSPLDLGDPELSLFGSSEDSSSGVVIEGTAHKDHSLLLDPFEPEEPWASLHSVMW